MPAWPHKPNDASANLAPVTSPGTFGDGLRKERLRRGSLTLLRGTTLMYTPDMLRKENALVAMLALLNSLDVVRYDKHQREDPKGIFISLHMMHEFIRRQVK